MRDIPFVDAHVHLWDLGRLRYPWLTPPFTDDGPNGSVAPIARDYRLDDYLAEAAGWTIAGMVHVEAGAAPDDALAETSWLQATADARALPSGIVAFAALDDPRLDALLEGHTAHGAVRGIRHIVNWHPDPRRTYTPRDVTEDPAWQRGFGLLARHGLSFDLQAYPGQFAALARLMARHPDTQVVVNHIGMPVDQDADARALWVAGMTALAALPGVAVKISGIGFIDRAWTEAMARPNVLRTIDIFGTDRCLFASNFPTDRLFAGFDETLGTYAAIIASFSEAERRAVWGGNANRVYRLGLDLKDPA